MFCVAPTSWCGVEWGAGTGHQAPARGLILSVGFQVGSIVSALRGLPLRPA